MSSTRVHRRISTQVCSDWLREDKALLNNWLLYAKRFEVPQSVQGEH